MCRWTASQGMRKSAPISGGPNGSPSIAVFVKGLDEVASITYCQVTLPARREEEQDDNQHARRDQGRGDDDPLPRGGRAVGRVGRDLRVRRSRRREGRG